MYCWILLGTAGYCLELLGTSELVLTGLGLTELGLTELGLTELVLTELGDDTGAIILECDSAGTIVSFDNNYFFLSFLNPFKIARHLDTSHKSVLELRVTIILDPIL